VQLEDVSLNLKDLKKLGVKVIDFTGGEPFLHRGLPEMLRMAKSMGFITTVTTNTLLYPKYAAEVRGLIDMLHFSLDSAQAEKHNAMRGVACFNHVMQSIKLARKLGEKPDILFTVFAGNIEEIELVYQEITLPNHLVLILNPVFQYGEVASAERLGPADLEILRAWGRKKGVYLNDAFLALRKNGGNQVANPVCKAGSTTVVITPHNGLMLPCYHAGIEEFPIQGRLYELYRAENVQKLMALEGRMPACQGCVVNCYMQPSFSVNLNKYWWMALPSTLKYNLMKGTWKQLLPNLNT
jgi:MoaA/NifB/PqqE/SkfB family radical SAM enzyme